MMDCRQLVIVTMLASALFACGGDTEPRSGQSAAGDISAGSNATSAGVDASEATRDMVSGVTAGKQGELVDLKFELKSRPQVGEPLTIDVMVISRIASEQLRATFIANDGLSVSTANAPPEYQNVQANSMFRQQLIVVPKAEGVYYLNAVVMIRTATGDVSRTFSIPVLVGPPPEEPESAAAQSTTAGE